MNVKPLLKYFPEIHHLPQEEQFKLVASAHEAAFGQEHRLRTWRNNLISCALLTGLALLLITVLGPLLALSSSTTATLMILVVLPGFFFIQQRRYISQLRTALAQQLPAAPNASDKP